MTTFELDVAIGTLVVVYTSSIIGLVMWLSNKFRAVERIFYRELSGYKARSDHNFLAYGLRIQRLELKAFGFTESPPTELPTLNKNGF